MKYSTLWNQFQTINSVWFNPYTIRNTRVHTQQCGDWRPGDKSTMPTAPHCWSAIHPYGISLKQFTQCGLTLKQLETLRYILRHVAANIMVHKHHATSKSVPIKCSLCWTSFMAVYSMIEPLKDWKCMGAYSALWKPMSWCQSTRTLALSMLMK